MGFNDTRAPPTIATKVELDSYKATIDDILLRVDFKVTSVRLEEDEHRDMLDALFRLPNDPQTNGSIARHFYDLVKSGHVRLYDEYFPKLEERVVKYERGERDE